MNMRGRGWLIGVAFALAVPGLALVWAGDPPSPFAAPRLAVVHLLASVPLAIGLALFLTPILHQNGLRFAVPSAVVGVVVAVVTFAVGPMIGSALDRAGAGFVERLLVRTTWALILELPWCLAACGYAGRFAARPSRLGLALAALAALAPPALFADRLADQWTRQAADALAELRLDDARRLLSGLTSLGSTVQVAGHSPSAQLAKVDEHWRALEKAVARPLPDSASPAARVERARLLGVLGRLDDAAALTEPLQDADANAAQLLAVVRQKQKRYEESSVLYRKALAALGEGPEAIANRVQGYDGLAFNARAMQRPGDAEAAYREAMTRLPAAAAYFHFQRGRHYQLAGRPVNALEHLQQAAKLDRTRYAEQARPLIEELSRSTPGCFVGRPK